MRKLSGYSAAVLSPGRYPLVDITLLTRAIPMVATRAGPPPAPVVTASAALLWEGANNLPVWVFGSLRPSFVVQPFVNAAFSLPFPRSFPPSQNIPEGKQSFPVSSFPSRSEHESHRLFLVFVYKAMTYIVLYHKNTDVW